MIYFLQVRFLIQTQICFRKFCRKKNLYKNPTTASVEVFPDLIAKVRYVDFQKRSHTVEVQIAMRYKRIENLSDHLKAIFTNKNDIF